MDKLFAKRIDASLLVLVVALLLASLGNVTFWAVLARAVGGVSLASLPMLVGTFLIVVLFFNACLTLVSFRYVAKPVLMALVLVASATGHFIATYGIVIDKAMIQNVFETDTREAAELISWQMATRIGLLGMLPSLLIARSNIQFPTGLRGLLKRSSTVGGSLLLAFLLLVLLFKSLAPTLHEHRDPRFCGPRAPRNTERWRPFDEKPMQPQSQRLAVVILRSAFDWLIKVRYLGGNPWVTVKDPAVTKRKHLMKIDRALRRDTWETVVEILQRLVEVEANRQDRVALAALLLMGDSGLRRAEVVSALRANFIPSPDAAGVWMLTVEGKRKVERDVPVNSRTEEALRAHWCDRHLNFDDPTRRGYLIAPIVTPVAKAEAKRQAREQRAKEMGTEEALAELEQGNSYHVNSLYYVVDAALRRVRTFAAALSLYEMPAFSQDEIIQLQRTSPHAFRHTYATNAVEDNVPMEVVQDVLGHVNIMTTKLYAKTRQRRIAQEAAKQFARNEDAAEKRRREKT